MAVMHLLRNPKRQRPNLWSDSQFEYIGPENIENIDAPWKRRIVPYSAGPAGLHEEIVDFFDFIKPTLDEFQMREDVVFRLRKYITKLWPQAIVEFFGSSRTGLFLPTSDIDMVVIGEWPTPPLRTLEKELNACGFVKDLKVLDNATVPILKLTDTITRVNVDISFNMSNGLRAADLILEYVNTYPALAPLVMLLKQFLLQRGLNEVFSGGLSSYALTLMIVSFLQLHPREDARSERANLGVLLMEFFELYGHKFKYATVAIRVGSQKTQAAYVPKEEVIDCSSRPRQSILCIEDPLRPGNDIARSSYAFLQVKHAFEYAFLQLHSALLSQDRSRSKFRDPSVLSKLVCIPPIMINYRNWIAAHYSLARYKLSPSRQMIIPQAMCNSNGMQHLLMLHVPVCSVAPNELPSRAGNVTPESGVHSAHSAAMSTTGSLLDEEEGYSSDCPSKKGDSSSEEKEEEEETQKTEIRISKAKRQDLNSNDEDPDASQPPLRRHSTCHPSSSTYASVSSSPNKNVPQSVSEPMIAPFPKVSNVCETSDADCALRISSSPSTVSVSSDGSSSAETTVLTKSHSSNAKRTYASVVVKSAPTDKNDNDCLQSVGRSGDDAYDVMSRSSAASPDAADSCFSSSDLNDDAKEDCRLQLADCGSVTPLDNIRVSLGAPSGRRASSQQRRSVSRHRRRSPSLPSHSAAPRDSSWQQPQRRKCRRRRPNHGIGQMSSSTTGASASR